ncbi:MAG: nickel pincer cofactor biosynthesis protein LarC [Candidatus Coatesbacteria bacterium]
MRILYLDCSSGVSGDMVLGALLDLGEAIASSRGGLAAAVARDLRRLRLPAWSWRVHRVRRRGFAALRVDVRPKATGTHGAPSLVASLERRARSAGLSSGVAATGARIVARILRAESAVHGRRVAHVHLHELEDVDTAVDVFGSLLVLHRLGVERVFASPVTVGSGRVGTAHGDLPVPAPATAELLRGRTVRFGLGRGELATPTGAALVAGLAEPGLPPPMLVDRIGCGAGARDPVDRPNILRAFLGTTDAPGTAPEEELRQLDAVVDDMSPQLVQAVLERVYRDGALEAWTTAVSMKRNRPGVALTVLAPADRLDAMVRAVLEETGTLGVRITRPERVRLVRREVRLGTRWGALTFKVAGEGASFHAIPEWREVRRLAARHGVPARLVLEEARGLWARLGGPKR